MRENIAPTARPLSGSGPGSVTVAPGPGPGAARWTFDGAPAKGTGIARRRVVLHLAGEGLETGQTLRSSHPESTDHAPEKSHRDVPVHGEERHVEAREIAGRYQGVLVDEKARHGHDAGPVRPAEPHLPPEQDERDHREAVAQPGDGE